MGRRNGRAGTLMLLGGWVVLAGTGCRRAAGDSPYAREVDEAIPRIEAATGLSFKRRPRVEVRSERQVHEFLVRKFNEESPAQELAGEQAAYTLLGLLPERTDLRALLLRVLGEQVVGYYDPAAKVLYVVQKADEKIVGVTILHELVHALQDQYTNLDSLQKSTTDTDRLAAIQAVIEGEAQFEQLSIMLGGGNNIALRVGGRDRIREMIRDNQSAMPAFAEAPMVVQESLLFPYLTGADFVARLKEQKGKINPFRDLPVSTEQLLHTAAFFGTPRDMPVSVTLPAPRGATRVYENDLGEFGTRLFLYQHLNDQTLAARAAAGWDGDRYVVLEGPRGRGIVWASVWDSTIEAGEFADALTRATVKRTGVAERSEAGGGATFAPPGRSVSITPRIVQGRAVIVYSDLPAGMGGIETGAIALSPPP